MIFQMTIFVQIFIFVGERNFQLIKSPRAEQVVLQTQLK